MGSAFARPSSFVRLTPDYGGQDGTTGSMRLMGLMGFKGKCFGASRSILLIASLTHKCMRICESGWLTEYLVVDRPVADFGNGAREHDRELVSDGYPEFATGHLYSDVWAAKTESSRNRRNSRSATAGS